MLTVNRLKKFMLATREKIFKTSAPSCSHLQAFVRCAKFEGLPIFRHQLKEASLPGQAPNTAIRQTGPIHRGDQRMHVVPVGQNQRNPKSQKFHE